MTLLTFDQEAHAVTIVMDTLTCTAEHAPAGFRHKVFTFPQLDMIMAVTGTSEVGEVWSNRINHLDHLLDIEAVNTIARAELREIRSSLVQMLEQDIGPSTVYLFGFPHDSDDLIRYTYSSRQDFEAERYEGPMFFAIPRAKTFDLIVPETFNEWIEIAHRIREENGDGSADDTVPIGGDLFATSLSRGVILTQRIHRFGDYDETAARIRASRSGASQAKLPPDVESAHRQPLRL